MWQPCATHGVARIRTCAGGSASQAAGADGITAHLREDRRHICDADITALIGQLSIPLNFEMAATEEMQAIALKHLPMPFVSCQKNARNGQPKAGWNCAVKKTVLAILSRRCARLGVRVSIFIAAEQKQIEAAARIGAPVIELHTGAYCHAHAEGRLADKAEELAKLVSMAQFATDLGLEVHAGHGLCFETTPPIAAILSVRELNIGHFLIGESISIGIAAAIEKMRAEMVRARAGAGIKP